MSLNCVDKLHIFIYNFYCDENFNINKNKMCKQNGDGEPYRVPKKSRKYLVYELGEL